MNKILVTGVTSKLGNHVCTYALKKGYDVIGSTRCNNKKTLRSKNINYIFLDLFNFDSFSTIPKKCDAIIHIASPTNGTPEYLMRSIGLGTMRIIEAAKQLEIPKIIHVSSMSIYGEISESIVDKDTKIRHPLPYGAAKYAAECYLNNNFSNVQAISIRSPAILAMPSNKNFLCKIALAMLKKNKKISLCNPNFLFNNVIRPSILAKFLVDLIDKNFETYNAIPVACSEPIKLKDVVFHISKALNFQGQIDWIAGSTPFTIDISNAVECGFQPETTSDALLNWTNDLKEYF